MSDEYRNSISHLKKIPQDQRQWLQKETSTKLVEPSNGEILGELGIYKTIVNTHPDLIWFKDTEGVYQACNYRCEEFLGDTEAAILNKTDSDFFDSEVAAAYRQRDQFAMSQKLPSINEGWVTFLNDGHREFMEMTMIPTYDQTAQLIGLLGVGRNLTSRRESEEKLRISEERFSLAMRGANDGLWDWNLETDKVYYSPRWKSLLGYDNDELTNDLSTWKSLVHPDDKDRVLTMVQDYLMGQTNAFDVEMRMKHKEGYDVFVLSRAFLVHRESDQKAIRLVGTHVDISARKKAEIFDEKNAEILAMIATGKPASEIYSEIALMYESRHIGLRCSMLELKEGHLMHGGAPSLPKEYCDAVHGLKYGPDVGSCGTSTYTGKRVVVENIETDPKWSKIKHVALPHGMRCCWSEPIKDSSGLVLGAFGMYYNHPALPNEDESNDLKSAARLAGIVMERDHAQRRIRELAYLDELTGLASRANFYQHLKSSIQHADRDGSQFALLYIDLDDFKGVNDSLGHDAGDYLLREIAQRLRQVTRDVDFVARLSGDEFCIIVNHAVDDDAAAYVAQRCLVTLSQPVELASRKISPACSIGIAHYPNDGADIESLVKAADTSLYEAKGRGKNQYAFYRPELTEKAEYRFWVEQSLREAVEQQQLSLVYQPQVLTSTGKIVGVEALARWHHPKLGQVSPVEFIPTAERIGMIKPLTEWALRTACSQAMDWKSEGLPTIQMAVNISPVHFIDPNFVALIQQILNETGMNASDLQLEITESELQTDPQNLSIYEELRKIGVLLAIDDFGNGYSSFASLKHLKVDCLKIDKYFIDDMLTDQKARLLVSSMIEMGHNLAHGIVAEGVETPEQRQLLQELGCEISQGYLFSKPINSKDVSKLLKAEKHEEESQNAHPMLS